MGDRQGGKSLMQTWEARWSMCSVPCGIKGTEED
jgi:hypothetical protein